MAVPGKIANFFTVIGMIFALAIIPMIIQHRWFIIILTLLIVIFYNGAK